MKIHSTIYLVMKYDITIIYINSEISCAKIHLGLFRNTEKLYKVIFLARKLNTLAYRLLVSYLIPDSAPISSAPSAAIMLS